MNKSTSETLTLIVLLPICFSLLSVVFVFLFPAVFLGRKAGPNDGGYEMALIFGVIPMVAIGSSVVGLIVAGLCIAVMHRKK